MIVGWALTKLYGGQVPESTHGNCWSYAVPKFLLMPTISGLLVTLSEHAPVPHVRYVPVARAVSFEEAVPVEPKKGLQGVMDSFWYELRIRKQ